MDTLTLIGFLAGWLALAWILPKLGISPCGRAGACGPAPKRSPIGRNVQQEDNHE